MCVLYPICKVLGSHLVCEQRASLAHEADPEEKRAVEEAAVGVGGGEAGSDSLIL